MLQERQDEASAAWMKRNNFDATFLVLDASGHNWSFFRASPVRTNWKCLGGCTGSRLTYGWFPKPQRSMLQVQMLNLVAHSGHVSHWPVKLHEKSAGKNSWLQMSFLRTLHECPLTCQGEFCDVPKRLWHSLNDALITKKKIKLKKKKIQPAWAPGRASVAL